MEQSDQWEQKNNQKINNKYSKDQCTKIRVTFPYVRGLSEALSLVFHCHGVAMSMKPHLILKRMLVIPRTNAHHRRTWL